MRDLTTLGSWLRRFLCEYIVTERNLARNTQKSYRDTFNMLLPFVTQTSGPAGRPRACCMEALEDVFVRRGGFVMLFGRILLARVRSSG